MSEFGHSEKDLSQLGKMTKPVETVEPINSPEEFDIEEAFRRTEKELVESYINMINLILVSKLDSAKSEL